VLVTVVHAVGSTPREAGATMLVGPVTAGSIGGGRLEWLATSAAQALLEVGGPRSCASPSARRWTTCGGIVWLLAERIDPEDSSEWRMHQARAEDGFALRRRLADDAPKSTWQPIALSSATPAPTTRIFSARRPLGVHPADRRGSLSGGRVRRRPRRHGHRPRPRALGAQIVWVDDRNDIFPAALPPGVRTVSTDAPTAEVHAAPPGSYFLVMTHSEKLDFEICEAIFVRRDFAWFGLIGSASKRAGFNRRFTARGLPPMRLGDLTCPIGIAGIQSKHPAAIAAAVAAQLCKCAKPAPPSSTPAIPAGRPAAVVPAAPAMKPQSVRGRTRHLPAGAARSAESGDGPSPPGGVAR
jgi:xanthine dehydrogenase accessory factor